LDYTIGLPEKAIKQTQQLFDESATVLTTTQQGQGVYKLSMLQGYISDSVIAVSNLCRSDVWKLGSFEIFLNLFNRFFVADTEPF